MTTKSTADQAYLREQAKAHIARLLRMRKAGMPWYPTNKRQWNTGEGDQAEEATTE